MILAWGFRLGGFKDPHAALLIQDFKYRVRNSKDDLRITEQSGDSLICSFHPWIKEEAPISIQLQAITVTLTESASYRTITEPIAVLSKQSIQLTFPAGKEEGCKLHIVFAELKTRKGEEGRIWIMTPPAAALNEVHPPPLATRTPSRLDVLVATRIVVLLNFTSRAN